MKIDLGLDLGAVLSPAELDEHVRGVSPAEALRLRAENLERVKALGDLIVEKETDIQRASHVQLTCIRRFDAVEGWRAYGMKSCAEWVCWRLQLRRETARTKVRVARKLGELPHTDEAFRRGELSYTAVRALAGKATPQTEEDLIEIARIVPAQDVDEALRDFGEEEGPVEPWLKVRRNRRGVDVIEIGLPPEEAVVALQGIDAMLYEVHSRARRQGGPEEPLPAQGGPEEPLPAQGGPEEPLPAQGFGRAQAFMALVQAYLEGKASVAAVAPGRYEALIRVDREVLTRQREGRGHLLNGTSLSRETVRRLVCGSPWIEVAEDEHGNPLDMGRRMRSVTPAQQRALLGRDKHCRWPGCRLTVFLIPHHIKHWAEGGETRISNLVLACHHHHTLLHEGGFGIELLADGSVRVTDPSGATGSVAEVPGSDRPRDSGIKRAALRLGESHLQCLCRRGAGVLATAAHGVGREFRNRPGIAEDIPETEWKPFRTRAARMREERRKAAGYRLRQKKEDRRTARAAERGWTELQLAKQWVAEVPYN
jgi:hypothetical protein